MRKQKKSLMTKKKRKLQNCSLRQKLKADVEQDVVVVQLVPVVVLLLVVQVVVPVELASNFIH
jgi:hypothetical protein